MKRPNQADYTSQYQYENDMDEYRQYMERKKMMRTGFTIGGAVVAGLIGLTVLGGSWYTVDQGERGVILRNGAITGTADQV